MNNNITLIGMPASGKSTVGVILAKILGMDFVDTDLLIQKKAGKKLSQILEQDGLEAFLSLEENVCQKLQVKNTVIATGGSVIYGEGAMKHLQDLGKVAYLEIDYETLEKRLHHMKHRGVVLKEGQTKRGLYDERVVLYEKYADIRINESDKTVEETVEALVEVINAL